MKFRSFTLLLFLSIIALGCSSGSISSNLDETSDPITTNRQLVGSPPPEDNYDETPFIQMHDLIDVTVDKFYYCMGRIPCDANELIDSGFVIAIPKSIYNTKTYYFSENVSSVDPAGINYTALSDKSYEYEFMVKISDEMVKWSVYMPGEVWEQRLDSEQADVVDSKVQLLMQLIPEILRAFYQKHERLPIDGKEMFSEYEIIKEGWQHNPDGDYSEATFEFGIDQIHNRYYMKVKNRGKGIISARDAYELSEEVSSLSSEEQAELDLGKRFSFDEAPPTDYLIMDKWFDLDSLDEFYSEITN